MRVALVLLVVACGPGLKQPPAQQSFADAANDVVQLESLLVGEVTYGGLWFDSVGCRVHFGVPGEIKPDQFHGFAECIVALKLKRSIREDALGDVVVMTYAPGFEVEARIVNELAGPRLAWIGFAASSGDGAPTITAGMLETLRTTGDANGPLDPALASKLVLDPTPYSRAEYAWLKVCIDDAGAVTKVRAYEATSPAAKEAFVAAAHAWTFRPFLIHPASARTRLATEEQSLPVCAMVRPAYPAGQGPEIETLPLPLPPSLANGADPIMLTNGSKLVEARRIRGNKMISPDDDTKYAISKSRQRRITGSFRLCLDETGKPESVLPFKSTGFASYDRDILRAMNQWAYSPFMVDGVPVPVCTAITFIYSQR